MVTLDETTVIEFVRDTILANACLGYERGAPGGGALVCVERLPVTTGQQLTVHTGYAGVVVRAGHARYLPEPEPVEDDDEPHSAPPGYRPRIDPFGPPRAGTRRVGKPKPAMDQSKIGRRSAANPGLCNRDVWNRKTGRYEPCAYQKQHRDQCRSQAQIDARAEQRRNRRGS